MPALPLGEAESRCAALTPPSRASWWRVFRQPSDGCAPRDRALALRRHDAPSIHWPKMAVGQVPITRKSEW